MGPPHRFDFFGRDRRPDLAGESVVWSWRAPAPMQGEKRLVYHAAGFAGGQVVEKVGLVSCLISTVPLSPNPAPHRSAPV